MFQGCPKGSDVRIIQGRLNQAAVRQGSTLAPLAADGVFGAKTAKRVVEFQSRNGLVVDVWSGRRPRPA
jgi:peptidoglycan hydrolase-like protein with peptidoglycan-binding domain